MSDEKPQNTEPQGEEPQGQNHQQTPDPNVKPPSLIIVQEGYSPTKPKVPDQQVKAPSLVSIQCFEPKDPGAIRGEEKDSGTGKNK